MFKLFLVAMALIPILDTALFIWAEDIWTREPWIGRKNITYPFSGYYFAWIKLRSKYRGDIV